MTKQPRPPLGKLIPYLVMLRKRWSQRAVVPMLNIKCKLCVETFGTFEELRFHFFGKHSAANRIVQQQDKDLYFCERALAEVAGQGMIGHRPEYKLSTHIGGPSTSDTVYEEETLPDTLTILETDDAN